MQNRNGESAGLNGEYFHQYDRVFGNIVLAKYVLTLHLTALWQDVYRCMCQLISRETPSLS